MLLYQKGTLVISLWTMKEILEPWINIEILIVKEACKKDKKVSIDVITSRKTNDKATNIHESSIEKQLCDGTNNYNK
jgi:uncharacterized Fe-S cluster-containing MiaB family protein